LSTITADLWKEIHDGKCQVWNYYEDNDQLVIQDSGQKNIPFSPTGIEAMAFHTVGEWLKIVLL